MDCVAWNDKVCLGGGRWIVLRGMIGHEELQGSGTGKGSGMWRVKKWWTKIGRMVGGDGVVDVGLF